jgi:hypothetical protein
MLDFDADAVCAQYRQQSPELTDDARAGLKYLLDSIHDDPDISDVRWAAYMLATVRWECGGKWQPIEEYSKGKGKQYGKAVKVTDADGVTYTNTYYGRGYVQLTWKANYANIGQKLGLGNLLVLHPEHALEPQTAYNIMSYGMRNGTFTQKKLADFINDQGCDYVNARRIINGLDRAEKIAGFAEQFEQLLRDNPTQQTAAFA